MQYKSLCIIYRSLLTSCETGFSDTKTESPPSLVMKQKGNSDGVMVTATK